MTGGRARAVDGLDARDRAPAPAHPQREDAQDVRGRHWPDVRQARRWREGYRQERLVTLNPNKSMSLKYEPASEPASGGRWRESYREERLVTHPKPLGFHTRNPKPYTLNLTPHNPHPKPDTLHPHPNTKQHTREIPYTQTLHPTP